MRAQVKTGSGVATQFSIDRMTLARIDYVKAIADKLLGVNASGSAIVRRALAMYVQHLEDIQDEQEVLQAFEGNALKRAHSGEYPPWRDFPAGDLQAIPIPTFSELLKRHHRKALENLGKQPVGTPSGVTTAARERILANVQRKQTDDVNDDND